MDDDLDDLFTGLKARTPAAPDALMGRVLADAAALQPQRAAPPRRAKTGFWSSFAAMFGGAGAIAGLASAAVAGLAIGFVAPTPADALTASLWGGSADTAVDLIPSFDEVLTE